jgi:hypothetical protein
VTNAKWRIHVPLQVSPSLVDRLSILVNGKRRHWTDPFVFDDSFKHSVELRNDCGIEIGGYRIVLIIDIWNENLTQDEKDGIEFISKILV